MLCILVRFHTTPAAAPTQNVRKGAVNPDSSINIVDALKIAQYTAGLNNGAPYNASIWVFNGTLVPAGWVITSINGNMWKITNLNGAPYNAGIWVLNATTVPYKWVITNINLSSWYIRNLNGAPVGATIRVYSGTAIPPGWVLISQNGSSWRIKCVSP